MSVRGPGGVPSGFRRPFRRSAARHAPALVRPSAVTAPSSRLSRLRFSRRLPPRADATTRRALVRRPADRRRQRARPLLLLALVAVLSAIVAGAGAAAELPLPRPKPGAVPAVAAVPVPEPRPRAPAPPADDAAASAAAALPASVPRPKPAAPPRAVTPAALPAAGGVIRTAGPDPEALRDDHRACVRALRALGARFERGRRIREGRCGAPRPLVLTAVGGVALSTPATIRCPAAVAFARWVREVVEPSASRHLRDRVAGLDVAASYACRNRRNGRRSGRLSEHGLANAIDISGVRLAGGRSVPVRPRGDRSREGRFQKEIRAGACGLFTTVLGPGSDGAHERHFHFDLAERRSGYRLCR